MYIKHFIQTKCLVIVSCTCCIRKESKVNHASCRFSEVTVFNSLVYILDLIIYLCPTIVISYLNEVISSKLVSPWSILQPVIILHSNFIILLPWLKPFKGFPLNISSWLVSPASLPFFCPAILACVSFLSIPCNFLPQEYGRCCSVLDYLSPLLCYLDHKLLFGFFLCFLFLFNFAI